MEHWQSFMEHWKLRWNILRYLWNSVIVIVKDTITMFAVSKWTIKILPWKRIIHLSYSLPCCLWQLWPGEWPWFSDYYRTSGNLRWENSKFPLITLHVGTVMIIILLSDVFGERIINKAFVRNFIHKLIFI